MSKKGSQTATSTTTSAPTPEAKALYDKILAQAQAAAATPYTAYGGELVAGLTPQQQLGISNINAAAGQAQPTIQNAIQLAQQAAAPIGTADIQQYLNPYTQNVVNATQAQFANQNAQQRQGVVGNAIAQGALGGNREAVAQAELANQQNLAQAPVLANLYSQGYGQAVNTALAEQQARAQGAQQLGNLGVAGEQAALAGAGAQLGAGTLGQQTQQAADLAAYQQFQNQQAYPFQTLSWLAGLGTGVGSQLGGTTTGTQTAPQPGWGQQLLGGLTAAGGLFGSIFSDKKVKENVRRIGKTNDGQHIYLYNYKGDPTPRVGLIAQEVEKVHPEAVGKVRGIKTVDYEEALKHAVRRARGGHVKQPAQWPLEKPGRESFHVSRQGVVYIKRADGGSIRLDAAPVERERGFFTSTKDLPENYQVPEETASTPKDPRSVWQQLTGQYGPRAQLWPEQMVRSALTLPGDVYSGRTQVMDPTTGHTSEEVLRRAQDLTSLVGSGGLPMAKPGALGLAGGRLGVAKELAAPRDLPTPSAHSFEPDYFRRTRGGNPDTGAGYMMFADNPNKIHHYGENLWGFSSGSLPKEGIVDATSPKFRKDAYRAFRTAGQSKEDARALVEELNPPQIVDRAGVFDSPELVEALWDKVLEPQGIRAVKTNDGAIVFDPALVKRTTVPEKYGVERFARGGAIYRADGGQIWGPAPQPMVAGEPWERAVGVAPKIGITRGRGAPAPISIHAPAQSGPQDFSKLAKQLGSLASGVYDKIKSNPNSQFADTSDIAPTGVAPAVSASTALAASPQGVAPVITDRLPPTGQLALLKPDFDSGNAVFYRGGGVRGYADGGAPDVDSGDLEQPERLAMADAPKGVVAPSMVPDDTPQELPKGVAPSELAAVSKASQMIPEDAALPKEASLAAGVVPKQMEEEPPTAAQGVAPRPPSRPEASAPMGTGAVGNAMDRYAASIARIESGGNYRALGPATNKGDRAYGKFQIMGANIPRWTQEVLGQAMTPQEFLHNPQAQEAVFRGKFGSYVDKYGPEGAARAWFGGPGAVAHPERRDVIGTSVDKYGRMFMAGLGKGAAPGGVRVASADTGVMSDALPPEAGPLTRGRSQGVAGPEPETGGAAGRTGPFSNIDLLPTSKLWPALTAAGFSIMASRAPNIGQAIGEGGLTGIQTYAAEKEAQQAQAQAQQKMALEQRKEDLATQRAMLPYSQLTLNEQLERSKPVKIGTNVMGDIYGIPDPKNPGKFIPLDQETGAPVPAGAVTSQTAPIDSTKMPPAEAKRFESWVKSYGQPGAEMLYRYPAAVKNTVAQVLAGDIPLSSMGYKDRTKYMNLATNVDPNFNPSVATMRVKTREMFAPDKLPGRQVASFDTATEHLNGLDDLFNKVQNGDTPAINYIRNAYKTATGKDAVTNLEAVSGIAADEVMKSIVPGGGGVGEREELAKKFKSSASPAQFHGAIQAFKEFAGEQLLTNKKMYTTNSGGLNDFESRYLRPGAAQVLKEAEEREQRRYAPKPAASTAPAAPTLPPLEQRKVGETYQTPKGPRTWMGQDWAKPTAAPTAAPKVAPANALNEARAVLAKRPDLREAVVKRLREQGIDATGL